MRRWGDGRFSDWEIARWEGLGDGDIRRWQGAGRDLEIGRWGALALRASCLGGVRRRCASCDLASRCACGVLALCAGVVRLVFWRCAPSLCAFCFGVMHRRCASLVLALCAGAVRLWFWRCAPALGAGAVRLKFWFCAPLPCTQIWRCAPALCAFCFGAVRPILALRPSVV